MPLPGWVELRQVSLHAFGSSLVVRCRVSNPYMGLTGIPVGDMFVVPFPDSVDDWARVLDRADHELLGEKRGLSMQPASSETKWPKLELGVAPGPFFAAGQVDYYRSFLYDKETFAVQTKRNVHIDRLFEDLGAVDTSISEVVEEIVAGFELLGFVPDRSVPLLSLRPSKFDPVGVEGSLPVSFGPNSTWLAVRHSLVSSVAELVGWRARKVVPLSWEDGVEAARGEGAFVTPSVDGWVLIMGADVEELGFEFLRRPTASWAAGKMQRHFGVDAQYFFTYRVTDLNGWGSTPGDGDYSKDRMLTVLGESGEVHDSGAWSTVEEEILDPEALFNVSEDDVFTVAGAWSVDPSVLGDRNDLPEAAGIWVDKLDFDFIR